MDQLTLRYDEYQTCGTCGGEGGHEVPHPQHDDPYYCEVVQCRDCGGAGLIMASAPVQPKYPACDWPPF